MFALNLLGGAVLEGRNGPVVGRAAHKRRLALLAILAVARGRPVGRERIIGLLWPEHPTDAARHLLSESLYVLRKELGEEAFVSSGDEVALNGEAVRSDVEEFERSVEEGDVEGAARLYRGPFLDGFYVSDAPEFERWAEAERDRLARTFTRALECLAEEREAVGRPQEAVEWWRRLAVADPYNSRVGMRLMRALDAAGERAAALWFAETHTTLLREELGVEPEDDFAALVERLKTEPVRLPPIPDPIPPLPSTASSLPPALDDAPLDGSAGSDPPARPAPAVPEPVGVEEPEPPPSSPAVVPQPAARPVRKPRRLVPFAGLAGVLAGLALALLPAFTADRPAEATPGYDPRRIAVLYFDDHSPGGELEYLASGLTESLIHSLSQVEALDVVSRNGVKPYRSTAVRFDSMVADLRVGSIVEGSVQRSGDSVRVTVQLIDAATQSHLESHTLVHPVTELFTLQDALADEVSGLLRRRLGREIDLRETRAETRSAAAWERVLRAEELQRDAAALRTAQEPLDAASADRLLLRADSLLALAEREDPGWSRPVVLRGWIAVRRSRLQDGRRADALLAEALARADGVLAREPRNALALELRGTVHQRRSALAQDGAAEATGLERAERDLRAAVAVEPSLASAWSTLSLVLRYRGHFAESDLAARRALAEDAYLEDADDIHHRLFFGALFVGDHREARSLCDQARRRFPGDWRFLECWLTLLREDPSQPPDPELAWRLVSELDQVDPPAHARSEGRGYSPVYRRAVTAAILARAGEPDSARAVLARARGAVGSDVELRLSLDYDEAYVRLLLGERETARRLLEGVLARRPALRPFASRDPLFRDLLRGSPTAPSPAAARAPRAESLPAETDPRRPSRP
ncbi:MAG TPA: BTAD domain-containing putative transcriptional regulator [Longimicrobiaceae bacterium]|nr:BTAD domain-containing putative transcriptional regulator [Longimicrobiaceae bacterium]